MKKKKILNSQEMNKIFGGKIISTLSKYKTADGCTVTHNDSFDDTDGNGVYNQGEKFTSTMTIE